MIDYWRLDLETVVMVLEHYQELSTGAKPESQPGVDNPETKQTRFVKHGNFEESCMLAAEVARRVRRCGSDGLIVSLRYGLLYRSSPIDPERIAQEWSIPLQDVYDITRRVSGYVTGRVPRWMDTPKRKGVEYREWVAHGRRPKCRLLPTHEVSSLHAQSEANYRA